MIAIQLGSVLTGFNLLNRTFATRDNCFYIADFAPKAAHQVNCSLIVKNKRKCEAPVGVLHLRFYSTKQAA